ncbi:hypothetical protein HY029_02595 [Candidatus Gottesmanbacteria bacterium]|nr:hypothetical protein [Candidatus Gottesmanbacteria bacterium]
MKIWWDKFYKDNKWIVWAAGVSIVLALGVLWKVKDEVTRFTLVMPIFAGFILFSILITADEEFEGEEEKTEKPKKSSKK